MHHLDVLRKGKSYRHILVSLVPLFLLDSLSKKNKPGSLLISNNISTDTSLCLDVHMSISSHCVTFWPFRLRCLSVSQQTNISLYMLSSFVAPEKLASTRAAGTFQLQRMQQFNNNQRYRIFPGKISNDVRLFLTKISNDVWIFQKNKQRPEKHQICQGVGKMTRCL